MIRELNIDMVRAAIEVLPDQISELGGFSLKRYTDDNESMFLCKPGVLLRRQGCKAVEAGFSDFGYFPFERPFALDAGVFDTATRGWRCAGEWAAWLSFWFLVYRQVSKWRGRLS